jgi:hypothetical protein
VDTKVVEKALSICEQAKTNTTSITYSTTIAQEVNLVVVVKRYRLVSVKQVNVRLVFPYRGKRWVQQEPIKF